MFDGLILRYRLWQLNRALKELDRDVDIALNCRDALRVSGKSYDDFDRVLTSLRDQRRTLDRQADALRAAIEIRKLKPANAIVEIAGRSLRRYTSVTIFES